MRRRLIAAFAVIGTLTTGVGALATAGRAAPATARQDSALSDQVQDRLIGDTQTTLSFVQRFDAEHPLLARWLNPRPLASRAENFPLVMPTPFRALNREQVESAYRQARCVEKAGRYEAALKAYAHLVLAEPRNHRNPEAVVRLGLVELRLGRMYEKQTRATREAGIASDGSAPAIRQHYRNAAAILAFAPFTGVFPGMSPYKIPMLRGYCLKTAGDYQDAVAVLRPIAEDPNLTDRELKAEALWLLGQVHYLWAERSPDPLHTQLAYEIIKLLSFDYSDTRYGRHVRLSIHLQPGDVTRMTSHI